MTEMSQTVWVLFVLLTPEAEPAHGEASSGKMSFLHGLTHLHGFLQFVAEPSDHPVGVVQLKR